MISGYIGTSGNEAPILEGFGSLQPGGLLPTLPFGATRTLSVGWGNNGTEIFTGRLTLILTRPDGTTRTMIGRDYAVSPNNGVWIDFSIVFDQGGTWQARAILSSL